MNFEWPVLQMSHLVAIGSAFSREAEALAAEPFRVPSLFRECCLSAARKPAQERTVGIWGISPWGWINHQGTFSHTKLISIDIACIRLEYRHIVAVESRASHLLQNRTSDAIETDLFSGRERRQYCK